MSWRRAGLVATATVQHPAAPAPLFSAPKYQLWPHSVHVHNLKNLGLVPRSEGLIQTGDWDRPDRLNGGLSKGTKGDSLTAWTREDGTQESD